MSKQARSDTTFGSIEGAAEYLGLLLESVNEARVDLEAETALSSAPGMERRREAIQLAVYKLSQLKQHLATSHRLLNDLRTIRRLLFAERQPAAPFEAELEDAAPGQFVTTAEPVPLSAETPPERPSPAGARRAPGRGPRPPA